MTTVLAIHKTYGFLNNRAKMGPFLRDPEKVRVVESGAGNRDWKWQEQPESGEFSTVDELATAKKIDVSYVRRMFRLNSLAPDIIEAILNNDAPDHLSLRTLYRGIPLSWEQQRRQLLGL